MSHLNTGPVALATWCVAVIRAAADTLVSVPQNVSPSDRPWTPYPAPSRNASEARASLVASLVYELLDAHDDTARMAAELEPDPLWRAHLEYLRALQRKGRETLAHLALD